MATVLLAPVGFAVLFIALLRFADIDGNQYTASVLAFTPYLAAGAFLVGLVALALHRRILAAMLVVIALSLSILLLPRYFSDGQPAARGQHLVLMSANLNIGQADAATVVSTVRERRVDVLSLPELTSAAISSLDAAGLAAELPYRVFDPGVGGDGSGIAARYPLRQIVLVESSTLSQPSAVVDLDGPKDIEVVAIHVQSPVHGSAEIWRRELADLPMPTPDVRVRILAGDFNATFDHAAFRGLIDRGYADAAEQTGLGLVPTWWSGGSGMPITIDHILVDGRCAVLAYEVVDLPGSDHDAVVAEIVLP